MKTPSEVIARIHDLQKKLVLVENATREELAKQYMQRDLRTLRFLNREEHVWRSAIAELEWLLAES